jgi:hypothetical protein
MRRVLLVLGWLSTTYPVTPDGYTLDVVENSWKKFEIKRGVKEEMHIILLSSTFFPVLVDLSSQEFNSMFSG